MTGKVAALFAPIIKATKLAAWPVGSIYMSMQETSPATLFGGTWERIANGRMLIGADSASYPAGSTGGEATHTLTEAELPLLQGSFNCGSGTFGDADAVGVGALRSASGIMSVDRTCKFTYDASDQRTWPSSDVAYQELEIEFGGGSGHNNMPPYIAVYIWRRTA